MVAIILKLEPLHCETYYISNWGSDSNDGLSITAPWKTIDKLNYSMSGMKGGDQILFERGSVFYGQINVTVTSNSGAITFGSYGAGNLPVISGSVPITGWKKYKGNIVFADVENARVKNVFVNDKEMVLARYPNSGFLTINSPNKFPRTGFYDKELKQTDSYWKGSNVRMRTVNWAYEYSAVSGFKHGNITFESKTFYPVQSGWGYYLDNNFNELDDENEWYFKSNNKGGGTIFLMPPNNSAGGGIRSEATIYDYGINLKAYVRGIVVKELEFVNQNIAGIYNANECDNLRIENCNFRGQNEYGISLVSRSRDCKVSDCRFSDINGIAVYISGTDHSEVSSCNFRRIGMHPGYGVNNTAFGMSSIVLISSNGSTISQNNIDSTGHDGIEIIGSNNLVEKNVVRNSLLLLNDGGGIKCYGNDSKNILIQNNFIFNVPGNLEATNKKHNRILAFGIYLDAYSNNNMILNNTVNKCASSGMFLYDGCRNNTFRGNISYDNKCGIKFMQGNDPFKGNRVAGNVFVTAGHDNPSVKIEASQSSVVPASFDSNYYCGTNNDLLFQYIIGNKVIGYDLNEWRKLIGSNSDAHSKYLTGKDAANPELLMNNSDEPREINLETKYNYIDLNHQKIMPVINLQAWTSRVVFSRH